MMRITVLHVVLALLPLSWASFSFTVDSTTPASCGTVRIAWTGGTAPFGMTIVPAFDYPQNISLPDIAFSNGAGSYSWQVDYPSGTQLAIMMSDATGHGTGGVSQLLTVGGATSTCQMRSTATDFLFYLNETAVDQCGPVQIYWDKTAVQPVTIIGVIPGGQPFVFTSSGGSSSVVWNTNIAAGTQFILAAFDEGTTGIGGSSALMTVDGSSNSACLDDSSPSSTPVAAPSSTKTSSSGGGGVIKTVTAIATVAPDSPGSKISTGAIVGIVLGAILGFALLHLLIFWWCCRRQLAALLSHRKEMRGREVKHSGDMDLVSQHRGSLVALDDGGESSLAPDSRRTSLLWNAAGTGTSTGIGARFARSRSSENDNGLDHESAISPFWDQPSSTTNTTTRSPRRHSRHLSSGTGTDLLPPMLPHLRTDSFSSMLSMPLSLSHEESTTTFDGLPYLATSTLSPSTPSPSSPSLSQFPRSPVTSNPALAPTHTPPTPGASRGPPPRQTKAQMAASMSTTNPDPRGRNRRSRDLEGERQPRHEAPEGGFRRHEDAGRVDADQEPEVEDLPPVYRPEWETESQRRQPRH